MRNSTWLRDFRGHGCNCAGNERTMYSLLLVSNCETDEITNVLQSSGFGVVVQDSLPTYVSQYDLVLLDSDNNPSTCMDQVRSVRSQSSVPLIAIARSVGVTECVVTLEMGADDFLHKPIADLELVARVKSVLRRASAGLEPQSVLVAGDIELQSESRTVKRAGDTLHLTGIEFDLLRILLRSAGTLVTREIISREVFQRRAYQCNRSIDVHMSSLRKKLGPRSDAKTTRIRTIRGYGYIYTNGN